MLGPAAESLRSQCTREPIVITIAALASINRYVAYSAVVAYTVNDFVEHNEQELAAGRQLVLHQAYDMGGGQIRYDGVWESGSTGQTHILGESQGRFADRYSAEIGAGHHVVLMQSFTGR